MRGWEVCNSGLGPRWLLTDLCEENEVRVSVITPLGDPQGSGLGNEGAPEESPAVPSPALLLPGPASGSPPTPAESHRPASAHASLHLEHLFCSDSLLP